MVNFANPGMLYLLALVPLAGILMWVSAAQKRRAVARFGNPELLARAGMSVSTGRRAVKAALILLSMALMTVALAGPQWGASREKIERKGADVMVALDVSKSMLAQDVAPSRIIKARQAVTNLIELMQGDRIGIVAFAGSAITMCPLTLDYGAARMFLDAVDTHSVPEPGTDIAGALLQAAESFEQSTDKHKVIILISDGEHLEEEDGEPVEAAKELADKGVAIYTVGVGDPKGSSIPVPTPDGVVDKTDADGEVVITRLDEDTLRKITLAGSGKYRRLDNRASGDELAQIYEGVAGMEEKTFEERYQVHFEDRFQWFVAAALVMLLIEVMIPERRRARAVS